MIVTFIWTYFFEKTELIYSGAFKNALFLTGHIVAFRATHFPLKKIVFRFALPRSS
jgi:hypothetical protein